MRFNSAKLSLVNPSRIITLPSGSTTEVVVSATTRTSGQFPVSVWVATPQGNLEVVPHHNSGQSYGNRRIWPVREHLVLAYSSGLVVVSPQVSTTRQARGDYGF